MHALILVYAIATCQFTSTASHLEHVVSNLRVRFLKFVRDLQHWIRTSMVGLRSLGAPLSFRRKEWARLVRRLTEIVTILGPVRFATQSPDSSISVWVPCVNPGRSCSGLLQCGWICHFTCRRPVVMPQLKNRARTTTSQRSKEHSVTNWCFWLPRSFEKFQKSEDICAHKDIVKNVASLSTRVVVESTATLYRHQSTHTCSRV